MNVYVGNLSYSITQDDLKTLFEEFGEVSSVNIITDKFTGRSKGFGFVDMPQDAQGEEAINQLNEKEVGGRNIKVNKARPRSERPQRSRGRRY